ncbi:MAG: hypothetical protein WBA74_03715, partial [Cyclobacteriaceae bacterium]
MEDVLVIKKFYKLFWYNEACQKIFLNHKEQLLEKRVLEVEQVKEHLYLPRIVLSNSTDIKQREDRFKFRLDNRGTDLDHNLKGVFQNNNDQGKSGETQELMKSSKWLKQLAESNLTSGTMTMDTVASIFSEQDLLDFLKMLGFIQKEDNSLEKFISPELQELLGGSFLKGLILKFLNGLRGLVAIYDHANFRDLFNANTFNAELLYHEKNYIERLELFDSFYEIGLLTGGHDQTYYECTNCDEGVFLGNVQVKVRPSKVKLNCPNCEKAVFYLAPYRIADAIYEHIIHSDGLLFHAAIHYLIENKLKIETNQKIGGEEIDLLITCDKGFPHEVVEVKMFRSDTRPGTVEGNINQSLSKITKRYKKLIELDERYKKSQYLLLTNVTDDNIIKKVQSEFKNDVGLKIKILTP